MVAVACVPLYNMCLVCGLVVRLYGNVYAKVYAKVYARPASMRYGLHCVTVYIMLGTSLC